MILARVKCVQEAKKLSIGTPIRRARLKAELSLKEAARKLGVSATYLSFLERSRPDPLSDELLDKLVEKLGVSRTSLKKVQRKHNLIASEYYRAYREHKKNAA